MNALTHRAWRCAYPASGDAEYESDGKLLKSGSNMLQMHYGNKFVACQKNFQRAVCYRHPR